MNRSDHFILEEFFPHSMMEIRADKLWSLLDARIIWTADQLRERFGTAYINNWAFGGRNKYRGFRRFNCGIGAKLSQHKFGRAIDITFKDVEAAEIREALKAIDQKVIGQNWLWSKYITACEDDVSWLHVDCRFTGMDSIFFFKP